MDARDLAVPCEAQSEPADRFDILPLLVATDGMLAAVGHAFRRFRPNLVIGGVPGLTERQWESARLRIGPVVVGIDDLRTRCIMTTFDPDSGPTGLGSVAADPKGFQRPPRLQQLCCRARPRRSRRHSGVDPALTNAFIGVDLGWYGKPSGMGSIGLDGAGLRLRNMARLEAVDEILDWIQAEAGSGSAAAAVDAPLVISEPNWHPASGTGV